jgi:hypothetical protein
MSGTKIPIFSGHVWYFGFFLIYSCPENIGILVPDMSRKYRDFRLHPCDLFSTFRIFMKYL